MENKTISILGCGWLGLPLAKNMVSQGLQVKGSTTRGDKILELQRVGIDPYVVSITDMELSVSDALFFDSQILFVNFPPRRISGIEEYYPAQFDLLLEYVRNTKVRKIIFASSTSVYPNTGGIVDETCTLPADKASGKAIQLVEKMIMKAYPASVVIRFGGLVGADRNPGRFLAGKKNLKNGNVPINLIHLDDCIRIVSAVVFQSVEGVVFNAVMPQHSTRKEFYTKAAVAGGFAVPEFSDEEDDGYKIVRSSFLEKMDYTFLYKSPLDILNT